MAAEPKTGGVLHNRKVMVAVAVIVLAGVAWFMWQRSKAAASAASGGAPADTGAALDPSYGTVAPSLGGTPAGGDGGASGFGPVDLESLFASQRDTFATIFAGSQDLVLSQNALVRELATGAQSLAQTAEQQLGSLAGSAVGGLATGATGTRSAAGPAAASTPAVADMPHDVTANPGVQSRQPIHGFTADPGTPAAAYKVVSNYTPPSAASGGSSGAAAVKAGAKVNTQAARNAA